MLFMYIHTHPLDKCVANKPEEMKNMAAKAREGAEKAGVKMIGSYVAPHEHTSYIVFDAPDIMTLEKLLIPMALWGTARLIPVITLEQAVTMVQ